MLCKQRTVRKTVIVLRHGSFSFDAIDSFAIDLDKEEKKKSLRIGDLIKVDNWNYRCYSQKIDVFNDAYIIIAVNIALRRHEEKKIADQIGRYMDVLVWKQHLE